LPFKRFQEIDPMPKMPQFRFAAAAASLLAFAACTGLGDLQTPQLEVLGVQMLSTDMFAQRFVVRMHGRTRTTSSCR
jgi:hypothetical protein